MKSLYETFKRYQVSAASAEEFRQRYTKPDRYARRGPEYVVVVLQSAHEALEKYGYTIISRHDSITGEVVAYYAEQ